MSTLKLNCNLGNFGGPVQGPVPKLGPVLVLGPQDRSGPDRLQTLDGSKMKVEYNDGDDALVCGKIEVRWRLDKSKIEVR